MSKSKVKVRHFYKTVYKWSARLDSPGVLYRTEHCGGLVATIATLPNDKGGFDVAVARVHPDDQGRKWAGRKLAIDRLFAMRYAQEGVTSSATYDATDQEVRDLEKRNLVFSMTKDELIHMIRTNPFSKPNCPYGRKV